VLAGSPLEFAKFNADETKKWTKVISSGFTGIFEIVAADEARDGRVKARDGRVKKETHSRRDIHCRTISPFATLAARSALAIPTCPRGRRGQGSMLNHRVGQLATQRLRPWLSGPFAPWAGRVAKRSGQQGCQG
jgi:hypothetical protein